ncbi:hypothetical protein FKM82_000045 [Ascaphus truei]
MDRRVHQIGTSYNASCALAACDEAILKVIIQNITGFPIGFKGRAGAKCQAGTMASPIADRVSSHHGTVHF